MTDESKEDIQKNTFTIEVFCYPRNVDSIEEVRAYLKRVGIDITEIDPPDDPPPNKKIPYLSFALETDKAGWILDILRKRFSTNPYEYRFPQLGRPCSLAMA